MSDSDDWGRVGSSERNQRVGSEGRREGEVESERRSERGRERVGRTQCYQSCGIRFVDKRGST